MSVTNLFAQVFCLYLFIENMSYYYMKYVINLCKASRDFLGYSKNEKGMLYSIRKEINNFSNLSGRC